MFAEGLEEFDDSRHVVQDLIDEYEACETPDYLNYVSTDSSTSTLKLSCPNIYTIGKQG